MPTDWTVWIPCQQQGLFSDGARSQDGIGQGVQEVEAVIDLAIMDITKLGKLIG